MSITAKKVGNRYGCTGSFKGFETALPDELYGQFRVDEYYSIISEFNSHVRIPKVAVFLFLVMEMVTLGVLFFAINKNLLLVTYIAVGVCSLLSVGLVVFALVYQSSKYFEKGIAFTIKPKYLSCSGKKFRFRLTIQYPDQIVQIPLQQAQSYQFLPPTHIYGVPQFQPYMTQQQQQQMMQQQQQQPLLQQQQQPQSQQTNTSTQTPQPMPPGYFQQYYPQPVQSTSNPFLISIDQSDA
ncbi:hypothetical protein PPL_01087 [Heterostelium album PN500]|uniref:Uncharacterized protein n=1 Tax=Heterostelium pallidum (strain ATCC 26659 / Pp 5 / PN500) TaxID=670386 RepID=D3AY28_HETP5|nr:hypothetical protein PPL_01087 [Heterostelium album PN500]EFA85855.1 hypothetical protein PPL_01087 [Heterostelium album PN500]|eukprot:XP_020437961.1 hypothetical protein PPL_01087 [Heterostelium album PN500]